MYVQAPLRLLLDAIVLHSDPQAPLEVIDSVCFGQDSQVKLEKGDQIKSGAQLLKGRGYIQIEETLENSMLMKIVNQLHKA